MILNLIYSSNCQKLYSFNDLNYFKEYVKYILNKFNLPYKYSFAILWKLVYLKILKTDQQLKNFWISLNRWMSINLQLIGSRYVWNKDRFQDKPN